MCLINGPDTLDCPICGEDLQYKSCTEERDAELWHCPACNRDYELIKGKWRVTHQQYLLANVLKSFQADSRALRAMIFEMEHGDIRNDTIILLRAADFLKSIQTRNLGFIRSVKARVEEQERIKPLTKSQKERLQQEKEELL